MHGAPDGVVLTDEAGRVRVVNAAAERILAARSPVLGQDVDRALRIDGPAPPLSSVIGLRGEPPSPPELRGVALTREDGSATTVDLSFSTCELDGRPAITICLRDASERERAEADLRTANRRLETASRAKDRFLASMSHELRTPLNAILGYVGTLLQQIPGPLNDEQHRQLEVVRANSRHLLSLLNDLLDLARIQSGKLELTLVEIDCHDMLEQLALGLRPLASAKGLEVTVDAPAGATVVSDRRALTQILINLTSNAIKYTEHGSVQLRFEPECAPQMLDCFSVTDTGLGIARAERERLFHAFESIGRPGELAYDSAGLGLHICAQLAVALHASITVDSRVGVGSTFTVVMAPRAGSG